MLNIETMIKINQDEIIQLEKSLNKIKKEIDQSSKSNDLFVFASKNFIRKSFLKDQLLFTDSIMKTHLPEVIGKKAFGNHSYTYYEYDKKYLHSQLNLNQKFINWMEKRVKQYSPIQRELFLTIFPQIGEVIFSSNQESSSEKKKYDELLSQKHLHESKIRKLKVEINNLYSKSFKISDYFDSFTVAQKIQRKFKFILGPTNSGKTYQAIEKLKSSDSGVYLAPLRLLALEIYQRLNEEGIKCNLITGEERIIIEGAKFTSSTIEMANFNNIIETAIIDEVQLLNDSDRGYAWTNAIIGVPAQNIICLGTAEIEKPLTKLISYCGENSSISEKIKTKRLNSLEVTKQNKIEDGTAIITFSRKEVLYYAEIYRKQGFNVSVIYGALSPEIRKLQIDRFNKKETDIIVATDAIGLGVNLPINKILFSSMQKFDGTSVRDLNNYEIKQISGRAGRYLSTNSPGLVSLIDNASNNRNYTKIKEGLESFNEYPTVIYFSPTIDHILKLNKLSGEKNIANLLQMFLKIDNNNADFKISDLDKKIEVGNIVEETSRKLELKDKFSICFSPIEDVEVIRDFSTILLNRQPINYSEYFNLYMDCNSLLELEKFSKILGQWAWFNNKYSDVFVIDCFVEFNKLREEINKKLDGKLLFNHRNRMFLMELRKNPDLRNSVEYFLKAVQHDVNLIKEARNEVLKNDDIKKYVLSKNPKLDKFYSKTLSL